MIPQARFVLDEVNFVSVDYQAGRFLTVLSVSFETAHLLLRRTNQKVLR